MFHFVKEKFSKTIAKFFCVIFLLFFYVEHQGQVFISRNPEYLKVKTEKNNLLSGYRSIYPDTAVTNLNNFAPRNFMGNIALPSPAYFFDDGGDDLGFRFFNAPTINDRIRDGQVEYFRTKGPYADLTAVGGSKLLQVFKMLFSHTYKEKVNITMRFNRYSSQGFYLKQQSYANNFFLSSNYTAVNKRFGYYFYVLSNGNKNQENGGIVAGRLTDTTANLNKALFPVKLNGANRDNRETKLMINPWLRLNRIVDSLHGFNHYLHFKSKGAINIYKYKDSRPVDDHFYNLIYLDTALTIDSSNIKQLSNELHYTMLSADGNFGVSAGYKHEIIEAWQHTNDVYTNHIVLANAVYRSAKKMQDTANQNTQSFESALDLQYVVSGVNTGNYKMESNSFYNVNGLNKQFIYFNFLYEKRNADRIYNDWYSNHFVWASNGYKSQEQLQAKLGAKLGRMFNASVFFQNIYNYLYYDEVAFPRQYNKRINNTGISLGYSVVFFRHLGVLANYVFQTTSNTNIVRVPQNSVTAKLFYTGNLFRNNLQLQIGTQVQVYQDFYAYNYMPSTQVFYLQNTFKTAPYPFVDVFLNARIRPVSFFLKMENALAGLVGTNYAFVPGYYQPPRAFRFGLTWMFFD